MLYIFVALLIFILLNYYDISGRKQNKEFWYNFVLITLILMAGMRYRVGVDSIGATYTFYHETPVLSKCFNDLSITEYPLWKLLNSLIFTIGGRWYWVQFIQTAFVNILLFRYFKRHCRYIFTCVFFYYIWLYAAINFEEMKASFAIVLSLYAYDYILEKKYINGVLLLSVACLFHFSAILVLPFAFMTFLRINYLGFALLIGSTILGSLIVTDFDMLSMFFDYDEFIAQKADNYSNSDMFFDRGNKNLYYYVVNILPIALYPLIAFYYLKRRNKNLDMMRLEPYLLIGFIMVGISVSVIIFYRYVNFYKAIFILFLSQFIVDYLKNNKAYNWLLSYLSIFIFFSLFIWNLQIDYSRRFDKFYPYSSVIERKVYKSKEKKFNQNRPVPAPRHDEY